MTEDDLLDPFDPVEVARAEQQATLEKQVAETEAGKILRARREAYVRVFAGKGTPFDVQIVTDDLRTFCRGEQSAFDVDARVHALLSGRQEVWMRIQDFTKLNMEALAIKYTEVKRV